MDDNRSADTITILSESMAVIPRSTVRGCEPGVGTGPAITSDAAFGDTRNTILIVGVLLANAVEMDRGGVVLHLIDDGHFHHVAPISLDGRSGNLAIDGKSELRTRAVELQRGIGNGEGISTGDTGFVAVGVNIRADVLAVAPFGSIASSVALVIGSVEDGGVRGA